MRVLFFLIGMMMMNHLNGQNLNIHKWKNRIILIVSENQESKLYQDQIAELNRSHKECIERKLVVYQILPDQHKMINYQSVQKNNEWIASSILFKKFAVEEDTFKVILIGLDGSIKLEKYELLTISELFEIIDSMPMRRSELENRNK